jgi:hypothetical protein
MTPKTQKDFFFIDKIFTFLALFAEISLVQFGCAA